MCPPEEEENNGSTPPKKANRVAPDRLAQLLERAMPFLQDEADKYQDDGSNEPLELIRDIREVLRGKE